MFVTSVLIWAAVAAAFVLALYTVYKADAGKDRWGGLTELAASALILLLGAIVGAVFVPKDQADELRRQLSFGAFDATDPGLSPAPLDPVVEKKDGTTVLKPPVQNGATSWVIKLKINPTDAQDGIAIPPIEKIEEGQIWYESNGKESYFRQFKSK